MNEESYNQIHQTAKAIRPVRFKIIAAIITAVLLVIVISFIPLIVYGAKAFNTASDSYDRAGLLWEHIESQDYGEASGDIAYIKDNLGDLDSQLSKLGPISWLPIIKDDIKVVRQFIDVSEYLLDGYSDTFMIFENTKEQGIELNLLSLLDNKEALKLISQKEEELRRVEENITNAKLAYQDINVDNFSGFFSGFLLTSYGYLGQLVDSTDLVVPAIGKLVDLLGYDEEKNYLLVFQNNMELRPTGGFIGSYGIITIENGKIKNVFTDDVYNLDRLTEGKMFELAPTPMLTFNNQKYWYMRDANWFANFPDSANNIAEFFHRERSIAGLPRQEIDGVIAITPDFIANLLEVVGPIESHGVTFSADNFAADLEQFVEFDYEQYGIPHTQRKAIIGEISRVLIERIESPGSSNLLDLWLAFKSNIDSKNILVYIFDENIQTYFSDRNWAGEIRQTEGDYLMVVDSNFASLKTDSVMDRSIKRSVNLRDNGDLIARLEVTYNHTGSFVRDLITRYRTYSKVYAPEGSWFERGWIRSSTGEEVINMSEHIDYGNEYNKSFAAYFVVIEPGESKTVILEYRLPEYLKEQYNNNQYSLLVQKQPGTIGHKLEIDLNFEKEISAYNSVSRPSNIKRGKVGWETDLSKDREYKLKF